MPFSRFPYFMNWSTSAFEAYLIAITVYKVLSFYFVLSKKLFLFLRLTRAWPQILRRMFLFPKGQQVHCVLDLSLFCFSLFLHSWILVLSLELLFKHLQLSRFMDWFCSKSRIIILLYLHDTSHMEAGALNAKAV